jgi:hypothetical protein
MEPTQQTQQQINQKILLELLKARIIQSQIKNIIKNANI